LLRWCHFISTSDIFLRCTIILQLGINSVNGTVGAVMFPELILNSFENIRDLYTLKSVVILSLNVYDELLAVR